MPNGETKDTIESTELTSAVTTERILGRSHIDPVQQYCLHYIYMFDLVHIACAPLRGEDGVSWHFSVGRWRDQARAGTGREKRKDQVFM